MSLNLIKSPIYDNGTIVVNAVAALSQVFFKVQRDDNDGTGWSVADNGGKAQFTFTVFPGALGVGDRFFMEHDRVNYDGPTTLDYGVFGPVGFNEYRGTHIVNSIDGAGVFTTTTDYISAINQGICTFRLWDAYTMAVVCKAETVTFDIVTIDYKIPYDRPVFTFDLKEPYRPVFQLSDSTHNNVTAVISASNADSISQGGSAIQSFAIQLFLAYVPIGREYGANLTGYVLRESVPGKTLTLFEHPRLYDGAKFTVRIYVDEFFDNYFVVGQFKDINRQPLGAQTQSSIPYDGLGFLSIPAVPQFTTDDQKYWDMFIGEFNGSDYIPISETKEFEIHCKEEFEIQLAWVNDLGGFDTIMTNIAKLDSSFIAKEGLSYKKGGTFDWEDGVDRLVQQRGVRIQRYSVTIKGLSRIDLAAVQNILTSSYVAFISSGDAQSESSGVRVKVVSGFTIPYNVGQLQEYDFKCIVELPDDSQLLEQRIGL